MKTEQFASNLKTEIKKQGYKLTEFAPDYLDMTIATFTNKCKKGTFTLNDILVIEAVLGVKFDYLLTGKSNAKAMQMHIDKKQIKPVKNVPKKIESKIIANTKSKLDILRGIGK